jgi:EmrB/QacA subfamily drug resistance transporter
VSLLGERRGTGASRAGPLVRPGAGAGASPQREPAAGASPQSTVAAGDFHLQRQFEARSAGNGWLLAVCCVAQFMVILDLSIVNVALPSIQSALGFSTTMLQWVVDAYAIVFAGFLMLGARVADHFGQRRTFVASLALFAATSLAGGLSVNSQMLVAARAFQGLSGALMAATSLAVITASFPAGPARHRAIGLWGAMNGLGGAAGTLFGGVLTQELSWRWVLLINPPIGIVAALVAFRVVGERRREAGAPPFDLAGALSLTLGQLVLVYGLVGTAVDGWSSPKALVPMAVGAGLLAVFVLVEQRFAAAPLVPLRELSGPVKIANVIVLLFSASLFPMWYVSSFYLQQVLGLSPLSTGLTFLPMALAIMLSASQAGKLVGRYGVRATMCAGLVLMAAGMLLLARIGSSGSALGFVVLPGVLATAGIGLSIVPSTIFATQEAGPSQAGVASGLVNTSRQAGGGLGLAVLITLATEYTRRSIGHNVSVPVALTQGFRLAYLVGAGLVLAALAATLLFVRSKAGSQPLLAGKGEALPLGRLGPRAGPERAGISRTGIGRTGANRPPLVAKPALHVGGAVAAVLALFAALDFTVAGAPGAPIGAYTTNHAYDFVSAPGLHPPKIYADVPTKTSQLAPGYILLTNFYDLTTRPMMGQSGPLVLNNKLQPVWFRPVPKDVVATNLEAQSYEGKPVLTWWQGVVTNTGATESGEDVVVNQHYQTVATLKGQDGWVITMHELVIAGDDAWVTANKDIPLNLSRYGGTSEGVLEDSAVQEYDIATGKLLYTWDALEHLPLTDSHTQPPTNGFPWDAYHVNSLQLVGAHSFLVSMRNTWAAYLVNATTGRIEWQLGGKHSSFAIPKQASFQWQHDVRLQPGGVVTMFNDNCCQITGAGTFLAPAGPSAGLQLKLHPATHSVSLVARYVHPNHYSAAYMGNMQLLPNGNVFIGWGEQPNFSEYSKSGRLLLDGAFPGPDDSYRALVTNWVGRPSYPPSGVARPAPHGGTYIYVSWNGATGVKQWRVLAANGPANLRPVAQSAKAGFETKIRVGPEYSQFEVQALDKQGHVIGTTKLLHAPGGADRR